MLRMNNIEKDTALHEAVRYKHLEVVRILTREDPDFSYSANEAGETPLYLAIQRSYRCPKLVDELLGNCSSLDTGVPNGGGTLLHAAIQTGKEDDEIIRFAREILEMCPELLMQTHVRKETPLLMAARCGRASMVEFLIERCGNDQEVKLQMMRMKNIEKDTALHEAVRYGHLEVVRILSREDPHFSYSANQAGETPLYLAIQRSNCWPELVDELLNNWSTLDTGVPNGGGNVLHAAVKTGNIDLVRKLLPKVEHNLMKQVDEEGCTPLHHAATIYSIFPDTTMAEMLVEKSSAYIKNKHGMTPVHIAMANNNSSVFSIISRCPDSCHVVDDKGRNALHYAVTTQDVDTVKLLLEHEFIGNDYCFLNGKDIEGDTPLLHMAATSSWHVKILDAFLSNPRVDRMASNNQNMNIIDMVNRLDIKEDKKIQLKLRQVLLKHKVVDKTMRLAFLVRDPDFIRVPVNPHYEQRLMDHEKIKEEKRNEWNERKMLFTTKYKESALVAATLIATVTFTAGFTLPGGLISNEIGNQQQLVGTAVLTNNKAFQAFIITDTIAMVLSTTSVFMNLFLTIVSSAEHSEDLLSYYIVSMVLAMVAMGLMVIAFVTGTYAVLSPSLGLAIATCVIGLSFFGLIFYIVTRSKTVVDAGLRALAALVCLLPFILVLLLIFIVGSIHYPFWKLRSTIRNCIRNDNDIEDPEHWLDMFSMCLPLKVVWELAIARSCCDITNEID